MHTLFRKHDSVAQQVEHIPFKDGVLGSSPSWITEKAEGNNKKSPTKSMFCGTFFVPFWQTRIKYGGDVKTMDLLGGHIANMWRFPLDTYSVCFCGFIIRQNLLPLPVII